MSTNEPPYEPFPESRNGLALDELANAVIGFNDSMRLDEAGPEARALTERLRNEGLTRTLVANTFWQAFLGTGRLRQMTLVLRFELEGAEPVVVNHGNNYTLLLEYSGHIKNTPFAVPAYAPQRELADGWNRAMGRRLARWEESRGYLRNPLEVAEALRLGPGLAREAARTTQFHILFVPKVETELTCVPQPAACLGVSSAVATAGAAVRDRHGRIGVTGPAHALPPQGAVNVYQGHNAYTGSVAAHEAQYTDSCVVVLAPSDDREHPVARQPSQGPLKLAPRLNSTGTFEGLKTSPSSTAIIKAANYELPFIDPFLQQTVRTDAVTEQGDSGAALVDNDGYIVGFAYSRNLRSSVPSQVHYSSWIWADAVFARHGLVPY